MFRNPLARFLCAAALAVSLLAAAVAASKSADAADGDAILVDPLRDAATQRFARG